MHLLIVEDDVDLGQALLSALRPEGFTCRWVRRLADVGVLPDEGIDCVLLDISLPDGNGLALLLQWRAHHARLPVIVVTARSSLEDRLAGLDGGADDFLVKPFAMAELPPVGGAPPQRAASQRNLDRLRIDAQTSGAAGLVAR
jgi:two-component system response regulator QseB